MNSVHEGYSESLKYHFFNIKQFINDLIKHKKNTTANEFALVK